MTLFEILKLKVPDLTPNLTKIHCSVWDGEANIEQIAELESHA